jgi:hypothetical protein
LHPVPGATTAALLEADYLSKKPRLDLRIMTHWVAVGLGVAPHNMGRVYGDEFYMREAVRVLDRAKVEVGRETTVGNDLPIAEVQGTHQGPPLDAGVYRRALG